MKSLKTKVVAMLAVVALALSFAVVTPQASANGGGWNRSCGGCYRGWRYSRCSYRGYRGHRSYRSYRGHRNNRGHRGHRR